MQSTIENPPQDGQIPGVGSSGWLAVGTRLLVEWGSGAQEIEIIASRGDCHAVKMVGFSTWREIMTEAEIVRRKGVVLAPAPTRKPSWWKRLFSSANDKMSNSGA